MAKEVARRQAVQDAVQRLEGVDWAKRCAALGLPAANERRIELRLLDRTCSLSLDDFSLIDKASGRALNEDLRILLLHYLAVDSAVTPTGRLVSFRDYPGGRFYEGPFRARSVEPLLRVVGNDPARLRTALSELVWESMETGDVGARIRAFGNLFVALIYRAGDEEFGPTADVLFDSAAARVLTAEDAAVLAQYLCIGLVFKIKDQGSKIKDQGSRIKDQGSRIKDQGSKIKDQRSRIKDQGSRIKDQGSRIKDQGSRIKDQGSRIKDQGSRIKDIGSRIRYPVDERDRG
jgi:hypothetical protein